MGLGTPAPSQREAVAAADLGRSWVGCDPSLCQAGFDGEAAAGINLFAPLSEAMMSRGSCLGERAGRCAGASARFLGLGQVITFVYSRVRKR